MNEEEKDRETSGSDDNIITENNISSKQGDNIEVEETYKKMVKPRPVGLNFDHYLGGGAIGFSLAMFIMLLLEWVLVEAGLENNLVAMIVLSLIPSLVGGTIGSFLFLYRGRSHSVIDGLKMGISGLIITILYTIILSVKVGGIYIIIGFLLGGISGSFISNIISEGRFVKNVK